MADQAPQPSIVDGGAGALSQTKITMQRATCTAADGGLSPPVSGGIFENSQAARIWKCIQSRSANSTIGTATKAGVETEARLEGVACMSTLSGM